MSFAEILRKEQAINNLTRSLIDRPAFQKVNVLHPDPARPEPGFIRATSWLYCLYFEGGRVSINFLPKLGEAYSLVRRDSSELHVQAVRCLRTELHHNLGFNDPDQQARRAAELWRRKASGTAFPQTDEEWSKCYTLLVDDAANFLGCLEQVVRRIESNGREAEPGKTEWLHRLNRSWPAAQFDPLIEDAKYRLGRPALKTVAFRNRHLDRWQKHFDLLDDGFDFNREATLLIEKTFLDDNESVLPITGNDIICELDIQPGPVIGKLLEEARKIFQLQGFGKDEILEHLREIYSTYNS